MSDLYSAAEILLVASELIGKKGPIEIDSRIYRHNMNLEKSNKGNDLHILGEGGIEVTFEELIELIIKLNDLVDELIEQTGRSYYFEGIERVSDNKFIMSWGS
ncbi:MAG: hypothetical protein ACPGTQ_04825 [Colwellia sp.]